MILLACEISQTVTIEFRKLGFEAFSCDLESWYTDPPVGGNPAWHIQDNVLNVIRDPKWRLIIAFPPCTHLANSGAGWFKAKRVDGRQKSGIEFFMQFTALKAPHVAIENPVGIMSTRYRKPDQIIQPYEFGDPYRKATCLWLKNLPELKSTGSVNQGQINYRGKADWFEEAWNLNKFERAKVRSKTFPGIAKAMAEQWSKVLQ